MEEYTFSELLKSFRIRAGLTQKDLADQDELRVHAQTIKGWENGRLPRYRENILQIAAALSLNHAETDRLLIVAGYPPEYVAYDQLIKPITPSRTQTPSAQTAILEPFAKQKLKPIYPSATAPTPPSHFTGRRQSLNELKAILLQSPKAINLALQGMGGIGKTITVQQLAAEVQAEFPGGIFWGALPDHNGNPRAILRAWGKACTYDFPDEGEQSTMADLVRGLLTARYLEQGRLLIIVDDVRNYWLEAAKTLQKAVPADTPFIITTRDETLALSLGAIIHPLNTLTTEESAELLLRHAGEILQSFDLKLVNMLIDAVGHLPLALELVGKHLALRARKPGYKLERLIQTISQKATDVLSLPGYPGLIATFANTYETLPSNIQRTFRWIGVFASAPMRVSEVAWVLGIKETEAESDLDNLVSTALLAWGETEGTYIIHPLLRQYAQTLLTEENEAAQARQSHLSCYLGILQDNTKENSLDYNGLEAILPNLTWAFESAINSHAYEIVNQFGLLLRPLLLNRGYTNEAILILTKAVWACQQNFNQHDESTHLNWLANAYYIQGNKKVAVDYLQKALDISRLVGDQRLEGAQLGNLALIHGSMGELETAIQLAEKALNISRSIGDERNEGHHLGNLGTMYYSLGMARKAISFHEKALEIGQRQKESHQEANQLRNLGNAYYALGELETAVNYYKKSLDVTIRSDNRHDIGIAYAILGLTYWGLGELEKALTYLAKGVTIFEESNSPNAKLARAQLLEVQNNQALNSEIMLHLIEQLQQIQRNH
jgi:tetratricopeptide (TPR) repeat protein/transcriptional regulator with XRE-family HTH domain